MSKENAAHLDAAIVNTLQEDTTASRKTIEWMTSGAVKLPPEVPYSVLPRKLSSSRRTRLEMDVALEDLTFTVTSLGGSFTANLHAELESGGHLSPIRMFEYDYELARKYYTGEGPLVFPVSYAVMLQRPPKNLRERDGIFANNALGKAICRYTYQVRYLTDDVFGTLLGPVAVAMQPYRDATDYADRLLSAMREAALGIEKPSIRDDYLMHTALGLTQRFRELSSILEPIAHGDRMARRALDNIVEAYETQGRSVVMRNLFEEGRQEGRQEGKRDGLEEAVNRIMKSLDLTRKQAEEAIYGTGQSSGVSTLKLGG